MRIAIDPNVRIENNWTYTGFEDVFGDVNALTPDDWVTAMWQETDQIFDAKVVCLDYERRIIDLAVDWASVRTDAVPCVQGMVDITGGGRRQARNPKMQVDCAFGCTGTDEAVHYGWYRCTPESRALLAEQRIKLASPIITEAP